MKFLAPSLACLGLEIPGERELIKEEKKSTNLTLYI